MVFALAFALAPIGQAARSPGGGPTHPAANEAPFPDGGPTYTAANERVSANSEAIPEGEKLPMITIYSTDNVTRGNSGSFVLDTKPRLVFGATYVNFTVSGTALPGVDYVALVSPAYIGQSGYGVIQVQTLPDPRGTSSRQAYSVVVTLEPGAGYGVGAPNSAIMWINP